MTDRLDENAVVQELHNGLIGFAEERGLALLQKCHVFLGVTVGRKGQRLRWLCQSAEQDLVFHARTPGLDPVYFEENELLRRFPKSFPGKHDVVFPLVIFEVKYGGVITHSVRQYSDEARQIKSVHPFCQYNLVLIQSSSQRRDVDKVYMAAKSFDSVLAYPNFTEKRRQIVADMRTLVVEHLKLLKGNRFYRLDDLF